MTRVQQECLRRLCAGPRKTSTVTGGDTIAGSTAGALIRRGWAAWNVEAAHVEVTEAGRRALAMEGGPRSSARMCTCGAGLHVRAILHSEGCDVVEAIRRNRARLEAIYERRKP